MQRKLAYAAAVYTALGLISGLLYRELTRGEEPVATQLSVTHTHFLALGTLVFLAALAMERLYGLSQRREMTYFWWLYNTGLVTATAMMTTKGILQLDGGGDSPAIAGISGLGHILLTAGFLFFFVALIKRVNATTANPQADDALGRQDLVEAR